MNIRLIRATETWQQAADPALIHGDTFDCIRMEKPLRPRESPRQDERTCST